MNTNLGQNRRCTKCRSAGPFYACAGNADGLQARCVDCTKAAARVRYAVDAQFRARARAASAARLERETPAEKAERQARRRLWGILNRAKKYGLTREQFESLLESQGGCCAICEARLVRPCIDHDHATGAVRGILCFSCNVALGHLRDDPKLVRAALIYLTRLRAVTRNTGA